MSRTVAAVVIVTRNRCSHALRAVQSACEQSYRPLEILLYDDASTDGTCEAVRRAWPEVRAVRSEERLGYIALRNRALRDASGDIVFSIDDDAYFTCRETVSETIALFSENQQVAAIALPYVEPCAAGSGVMRHVRDDRRVRGFVGCACALRRDVAVRLGGYREFFVHQGEERDLAIRFLNEGYEIVLADTAPVVHGRSPQRDRERMSFYGVRNTLLFDALNVPHPYLVPRFLADTINLFRYRLTWRTVPARLGYVLAGLTASARYWRERAPVSRETYQRYRALPGHGPLPPVAGMAASAGVAVAVAADRSVP